MVKATDNTALYAGLPPSKSHLIRWLLMASQGEKTVKITGVEGAAQDACAMRDALIQLGVQIDVEENSWTVHGVGPEGFSTPLEISIFSKNPLSFNSATLLLKVILVFLLTRRAGRNYFFTDIKSFKVILK